MKTSTKLTVLAFATALAACAPPDHLREGFARPAALPPAPTPAPMRTDSAKVQNEYESPKVDILFVIDNSLSMQQHEQDVIDNMDKFADSFVKNKDIDFHVGVVKVYDSIRFSPSQPTFVPNGQLLGGFVQRSDNTVSQLRSLLKVDVLTPEQGGPEFEEVFSPVKAALTEPMLSGANKGFYRPEAHLAVIMITDANDGSANFDETNLQGFLEQLKNRRTNKFSVYGVLANNVAPGVECKKDPSGPPVRINNLINNVGGKALSLCDSNFGTKLGKVGSEIAAKAVFNRTVELSKIPDLSKPLVVACEGKKIPRSKVNGWDFDKTGTRVVLADGYPACKSESAQIDVTYTVANTDNLEVQ